MKMQNSPVAKEGFKRQYNLDVTVEQGRELNPDKTFKQTRAIITSKDNQYILDEYLNGNLTDYVLVNEDKRFDKYITAEEYVADLIRKEK